MGRYRQQLNRDRRDRAITTSTPPPIRRVRADAKIKGRPGEVLDVVYVVDGTEVVVGRIVIAPDGRLKVLR